MLHSEWKLCAFLSSFGANAECMVFRRRRRKGAIVLVDVDNNPNSVSVEETARKLVDAEVRQPTADSTTEKCK